MKTNQQMDEIAEPSPGTGGLPEISQMEEKSESSAGRFLRRTFRLLAGLLIVFGLGVITGLFVWYMPQRQLASQNEQAYLESQRQITQLQNELKDKAQLETQFQEASAQLQAAQLMAAVLEARAEVSGARVALDDGKPSAALAALDKADGLLAQVKSLSGPEHQEKIAGIVNRLNLVRSEMATNTFAAQSDLAVLAQDLLDLQAILKK